MNARPARKQHADSFLNQRILIPTAHSSLQLHFSFSLVLTNPCSQITISPYSKPSSSPQRTSARIYFHTIQVLVQASARVNKEQQGPATGLLAPVPPPSQRLLVTRTAKSRTKGTSWPESLDPCFRTPPIFSPCLFPSRYVPLRPATRLAGKTQKKKRIEKKFFAWRPRFQAQLLQFITARLGFASVISRHPPSKRPYSFSLPTSSTSIATANLASYWFSVCSNH